MYKHPCKAERMTQNQGNKIPSKEQKGSSRKSHYRNGNQTAWRIQNKHFKEAQWT